jgi:hypothetical protein
MGIVWSVIGILICGGLGGFAAWAVVAAIGWTGTPGALAAAVVGMVVSVALWTGGTTLLRSLGWLR